LNLTTRASFNQPRIVRFLTKATVALSFFAALNLAGLAQDDQDEVKVDSSIVILNASIKDAAGRHVAGLRKAQFRVFEDGAEQQVEYFSSEETPFAAVILLDTSGSMEERVSMARAAAIRFLDGLRINDSAAIYRFDSKVVLVQPFSNSRDINEKIFDLKADGMTRMNDAVYDAAVELSKRPEKRRAIIVLSDGQDTMSGRSAEKALKAALAADVAIYTIDMSPIGDVKRIQNQGPLKNFSEKSGGTFVSTPGGAAMREAFEKIVEELGVQYTIGYAPANTKKDGKWRAVELRVARPNLTIRTRKGYNAEKAK
jgi:Ca-activated chloride channel homolog